MDTTQRKGARLTKRRPAPSFDPASVEPFPPIYSDDPQEPPSPIEVMPPTPADSQKTDKEKRSKWRNPFHSKDKGKERESTATTSHPPVHSNSTLNPDSAYGSSEPSSSFSGTANNVSPHPTDSDHRISRSSEEPDRERLQVPGQPTIASAPATPPIVQESHVEGSTIVTTTTTTTTTTVTRVGPNGQTTVQIPRQENGTEEAPSSETTVTTSAPPNVSQLQPPRNESHSRSPPIPTRSSMRDRAELDGALPGAAVGSAATDEAPVVTSVTPTTPTRPNFSYPGRSPVPSQDRLSMPPHNFAPQQGASVPAPLQINHPQGQASHHRGSTLSNLKSAAVGIHGAAETLRGTLNSTVDRRFGADAETMAKNDRVVQAGRAEINSANARRNQDGGRLDTMMNRAQRFGNNRFGHGAVGE
ncbi:uncharacterized protein K452DRAFT_362488 [Aplosporella prunicola CBS 121167]|uniref:Uncharacterized protein n=1 Tax=Aplosporella prunicola CBS 121167 TaxID=1176127 RepID=A0A6A6B0D5_9PEZI|nr:uncharacterized protein K452DRAFT_362488 [Aplosporella prunicola CBS 121167]KAF2136497.1 hypothetical protein K452DRAFT_362488 [Aplosporella prunicola CBS 121167]